MRYFIQIVVMVGDIVIIGASRKHHKVLEFPCKKCSVILQAQQGKKL